MDKQSLDRFSEILALAACDGEYAALQKRCSELDSPFLTVIENLPREEQTIVWDYIHALGGAALRLTELACETEAFSPVRNRNERM